MLGGGYWELIYFFTASMHSFTAVLHSCIHSPHSCIHSQRFRIHAYHICSSTWCDVCVSGVDCERCMTWDGLVGVIEVRMLLMVL